MPPLTLPQIQAVHDSITERFVPTCRHCKKTAEEHADGDEEDAGPCLFESTRWDPMTVDEWASWRKGLWLALADVGADFIRDQLRSSGIASRIKTDLMVYGNAVVEAKPDPGGIKITRVEPWLVDVKK